MNKKLLSSLVLLTLTAPAVALADDMDSPISGNVTLTNDYLFRGISQTGGKAAIQGGFDYEHTSGFYAGVWGSNISWLSDAGTAANASVEVDTYFGFSNEISDGMSYDVGYVRYNYPGTYAVGATNADTDEIYGAISYMGVTAKYSYSLGDTFGTASARGSDYIEIGGDFEIAEGLTLSAHVGKQKYDGPNAGVGTASLTYTDYSLGVSKAFAGVDVGLTYSKTNAEDSAIGDAYNTTGKQLGKGKAVLSVSRSF